ncbi:MAG: hypothetical protein KGH99_03665 [Thaumarchaeota archaeon]|nr:hypothetical protein [Nitrososphaerota archaeon]
MKTLYLSTIIILVLVISSASVVYAQSSSTVSVSLAKVDVGFFNITETSPTIAISGIVYKAFSQNIVLTIFNPQNQLISVSQLQLGLNGTFSQSIIPSNSLWPKGNYTVRVTSGSQNLTESVFYFPGIGCCKRIITPGVQGQISNSTNPLSPLKQFKSGISAIDVKCPSNYALVIKAEDGSPACVRPFTVKILSEVGWSKFESTQSNHNVNAKTNPFGIVGLMYYYGGGPCGIGTCPLNTFNLKMNSNYTTYLLGYHICNDNSCIVRSDLSTLLPLNVIGMPNYKFIALPENPPWKYDDVFHIQVEVSSIPDNATAVWTDLGNSTIIH